MDVAMTDAPVTDASVSDVPINRPIFAARLGHARAGDENTDPGPPVPMDVDPEPKFDATGLKEIGNLASWTVSTYKPGCGVEALRDDDTDLFWQ
jgi:anaphase-promoting complex subunit 10